MKNKIIIKILILSILILLTGVYFSCQSPTGPDLTPGRRDYTWTVDTLDVPFMSFSRIWGSSPEDIWIVGPGGGLDKTIYHFDGISWKTDGISRPISPLSVWGSGKNNVWFGGRDGRIWHYDGNTFSENIRFEKPLEKNIGFQEMWGDSPANIFAAGYSGDEDKRIAVLAHYNGVKWELTEFIDLKRYTFLRIRRANTESSKYYLWAIKDEPLTGDLISIFEYIGGTEIKLIYEGKYGLHSGAFIQKIDNEMNFVIGSTINKYSNNEFKQLHQISLPNFGTQIFGRNPKDIFLRMLDGIAHYNGIDFDYLYRFNGNVSITDAVLFDKKIFFLALDVTSGNDLIFKGKLN